MGLRTLLCAIAKDENQYLHEFVEYYKKLGFTNICLYDNNDNGGEEVSDVIQDYIDSGFVIVKDCRGKKAYQLMAYQDCYDTYGDDYDWVAFFDCDEFLTLTRKSTIDEYLSSILFKKYHIIHVNWMIYGDNGLTTNDGTGCLGRFVTPCDYDLKCGYDFPENYHVKSIVRGKCHGIYWKTRVNCHTPVAEGYPCCDGSGRASDVSSPFQIYNYSDAYLKHFSTKTSEEYANKLIRGFADHNFDRSQTTYLIKTRFFKYNEITPEKIAVFEQKLGVDLHDILPKDYGKDKDVKIYSLCFSKKNFDFIDDSVITPLQVGAEQTKTDVCDLKDNTGDNISDKNYFYIENTGIYWIWKNVNDCKYKGQMQYRRPLEGINENTNFDSIFEDYDVITCVPFNHPAHKTPTKEQPMVIPADTVEEGYAFSNCEYDLRFLEAVIKNNYPDYSEDYDKYIKHGENLYYSNGFIMRTTDYNRYCAFLFDILKRFMDAVGITDKYSLYFHVGRSAGLGGYKQRYESPFKMPRAAIDWQSEIGGFLSERIWTLWLLHNYPLDRIYTKPYIKQEEGMFT